MNTIARDSSWLAPWWKSLRPRWGHPWHSMCSYLAMFPPALPRYFIEQCSRSGDVVLDPFCGRGTTPLEACLSGRMGVGSDLNPMAVLLTEAKVKAPKMVTALRRLADLEERYSVGGSLNETPPEIQMLFDQDVTLPQLLYLRESLSRKRKVDRYLLAVLLGILHGNHPKNPQNSQTLSVSMPNTFSMSPGYVRRYIATKGLKAYPIDVFAALRRRIAFLNREGSPQIQGRVAHCDARDVGRYVREDSVDLIVTSPPYMRVVNYGRFNWVRLWMMRESVTSVDASLRIEATDRRLGLADKLALPKYKEFMSSCVVRWERLLRPGGVCVVVIGDVDRRHGTRTRLAEEAWKKVRGGTGLKLIDIVTDEVHSARKVTKIWGEKRGEATKTDRVLVMRRPGGRRCRTRNPHRVIKELQGREVSKD